MPTKHHAGRVTAEGRTITTETDSQRLRGDRDHLVLFAAPVRSISQMGSVRQAQQVLNDVENARRMAVCWNLCAAFPTETLEAIELQLSLVDLHQHLGKIHSAVKP